MLEYRHYDERGVYQTRTHNVNQSIAIEQLQMSLYVRSYRPSHRPLSSLVSSNMNTYPKSCYIPKFELHCSIGSHVRSKILFLICPPIELYTGHFVVCVQFNGQIKNGHRPLVTKLMPFYRSYLGNIRQIRCQHFSKLIRKICSFI